MHDSEIHKAAVYTKGRQHKIAIHSYVRLADTGPLQCSNFQAAEFRQVLGVERTFPVGRLEGRNAANLVIRRVQSNRLLNALTGHGHSVRRGQESREKDIVDLAC